MKKPAARDKDIVAASFGSSEVEKMKFDETALMSLPGSGDDAKHE